MILNLIITLFKIIGIIILVILDLILFLIGIALFAPVRYKVNAEKKEDTLILARVTWLLRAISIRVQYKEDILHYYVKIFGYTFVSDKPKKKKCKKVKAKKSKKKKKIETDSKETHKIVEKIEEKTIKESDEPVEEVEVNEENVSLPKKQITVEEPKEERNKKHPLRFLINLWKKVKRFVYNVYNKIKSIFASIKAFWKKIRMIKEFLFLEENREGFRIVLGSIFSLLRYIKPTKLICNIHFGTGDPCSTGQLLALISVVHAPFANSVHIIPDFEEKVMEGDVYARGRIRGCRLLYIGLKLYRDRKFKNVWKNINNLKEEL